MSDQKSSTSSEWGDCPQGTLAQGVRAIQRRRRRQEVVRLSTAAVSVFALVVVVGLAFQQFRPAPGFEYGNISCARTQSLLQAYATGDLDADTTARIEQHLDKCPHCGPLYEQMQTSADKTAASSMHTRTDWPQAACGCAECRGHHAPAVTLVAVRD